MNYEELSDFEINKRVAVALGHELTQCSITNIGLQTVIKEPVGNDWVPAKIPDYCNSPADAWPVIVENKIDTRYEGAFRHEWEVMHCIHLDEYDVEIVGPVYHKNPLRASMICYLMMQEAK